ncbi:hypothetical protein [Jatrophihabitans sp.]|uniref:hypothetical protein n=1 Tax=Jatrophihabitans sp. TaxID=1932789 RepID=UPI002EF96D79
MVNSATHLQYAEYHDSDARALFEAKQYSWTAVALFYCGMHLVHSGLPYLSHLTTAQQHPESHTGVSYKSEGTSNVVRVYAPSIRVPYTSLFDDSIDVRYHGGRLTRDQARQHRSVDLTAIAKWAADQITAGGDTVPPWLAGLAGHNLASGQ